MKAAIYRFITLDARNVAPEIYLGLLIIYAALIFTTINSIRTQDISTARKIIWSLFILVVPIGGMAIYALRCLITADHSFLRSIGILRSTTNSKLI
ncbi:MAG: PLDc N-terminal domain-containing protein [Verrucomicrobiales bacterium]|nr:PLDc N-terminal domain-containing protein [Verrucomicrobiales bacterium]